MDDQSGSQNKEEQSANVSGNPVPVANRLAWKELLVNKILDLILVILGVSIAFQLNNWKVESDQLSLERYYLESMLGELQKEVLIIQNNVDHLKGDQKSVDASLGAIDDGSLIPDSLAVTVFEMLSFETFTANDNTFSMLENGNGMSIIKDRALRTKITEYYGRYESIRRFESVYTEFIFRMFEFYSPHLDLRGRKFVDESVLKGTRTKNSLLIARSQLGDGIEDYEDALRNAKELILEIDRKLK